MELQGLLVLCGLGVAGAAVLLLMGLFSTSGTSYEEAIAQQRRATTELLALAEGKGKPKKSVKKANKKQAKREKRESATVATASEPESETPAEGAADDDAVPTKPHVDFKPPVVLDYTRDAPPSVKIRKRGKDIKIKPILVNKDDASCVSEPSAPPSPVGGAPVNHFEDTHPKDEFELLHSSLAAAAASDKTVEKKEEVVEKKENKGGKQGKGKQPAKAPAPEVKEEAPRVTADPPKEQKKAKKAERKSQGDEAECVREEVVPPLTPPQPSELTTEKLLKQAPAPAPAPAAAAPKHPSPTAHGTSNKNKKKKQEPNLLALIGAEGGVNVHELVRVVREAALSRTEIQTLTDVLLNKHHDQLPQHSEWTEGPNDPMQKLKKQLAEKEKQLTDETEASQALHAKLKELRASLNVERSRAQAARRAGEEATAELAALQARLARAMDEAHHAHQEKLHLQSKLAAEGEAQAQRVQMEMHIQRLSEAEGSLVAQLSALQGEAAARAHDAAAARCEAAAARDAALLAQQHAAELAQQLQEANRVCGELDAQRQSALHGEQAAQAEARALQERLTDAQKEARQLQARLTEAHRANARAQQVNDDNDLYKSDMLIEMANLRAELRARETEIAELKDLNATYAAPAQNGLQPTSDEHTNSTEAALAALRLELAAAQRGAGEQRAQVAALGDQLRAYRDKNNELRTKNWKVMEALQSAEKALQSKPAAMPAQDSLRDEISKAEAAQYAEVAAVLRAAWPAAAPSEPAAAAGRAWVLAFADRVRAERARLEAGPAPARDTRDQASQPPSPAADTDLRAQNEHLQALVDKYKTIIDDTEGVLSRLQQNVTAEEARWAQQLQEKQHQLDDLRQRTVTQEPLAFAFSCIEKSLPTIIAEMQKKIDSLEVELRQAKQNHSFADVERSTEERLHADLPNKHKLDSVNGPLQVEMSEK